MSKEVATTGLTGLDHFRAQVLTTANQAELARTLPPHIPVERFIRNFISAVNAAPKLALCEARLVYREIMRAAGAGLLLDPMFGEAYLIAGFSDGKQVPQLRTGYRGLIKLARQTGEVATIYADAVHEHDHIECERGTAGKLVHRPLLFGDRGRAIGYYAVIQYKDGNWDFEPMDMAAIERIREFSDGYKAFKANKIKSTPWVDHFDEMAKKTVLRRLLKRQPMSPDAREWLAQEDSEEYAEPPRDATPPLRSPQRRLAALEMAIETAAATQGDGQQVTEQSAIEPAAPTADAGPSAPSLPAPLAVPKDGKGCPVDPAGYAQLYKDLLESVPGLERLDRFLAAEAPTVALLPAKMRTELTEAVKKRRRELDPGDLLNAG